MLYWFSNTILAGIPEWLLWLLAGLAFGIVLYLASQWFGD